MRDMNSRSARKAQPRSVVARKARVAALVASGKVSAKAAKLIVFRAPSPAVLAKARALMGRGVASSASIFSKTRSGL